MKSIRLVVLTLAALMCAAVSAKKSSKEPVVMTINKVDVPLSEFEYLYNKNSDQQTTPQDPYEYAKLFVTYKLKVADAKAMGLDTLKSFVDEFNGYRAELAQPYLTDSIMADSLARAAYAHYADNVDVSHIMLRLSQPTELLDSLLGLLADGADFAALAAKYSVDPSAIRTGGRLGYIPAGAVPYTFEEVAWSTPVGQVSQPFDTNIGHHIVKVHGRRPAPGEVKTRHLLLLTQGMDEEQKALRRHQIDSLRQVLADGADFIDLANRYTEDPSGRGNGGDLPYFGPGRMVPEFEAAAFALAPGELSQLVETSYGYHLILCEDHRGVPTFDELLPEIKRHMEVDGRADLPRERKMAQLRAELFPGSDMTDEQLLEAVLDILPERYPDYRNLLSEYRDGMLLFEVANRKVWQRAATDTVGLDNYFATHRADYRWDVPRYKGFVLMAINDSLMSAGYDWIKANASAHPADLQDALRAQFGSDVRLERVLAAKGENKIVDFIAFNGPRPAAPGRWKAFMPYDGRIVSQPEEPRDVRGQLVADYQKELEQHWVDQLNANANVKLNNKVLDKLRK